MINDIYYVILIDSYRIFSSYYFILNIFVVFFSFYTFSRFKKTCDHFKKAKNQTEKKGGRVKQCGDKFKKVNSILKNPKSY